MKSEKTLLPSDQRYDARPSPAQKGATNSPNRVPRTVKCALPPMGKWSKPSSSNQGTESGGSNERVTGVRKLPRGRPRLDTMDQTAADRRRTQIRLAQRAYRNRKEAALSTLEERVAKFEAVNTRIRRELREFYEILRVEGVLVTRPSVAQRFRSLAKAVLSVSATPDGAGSGSSPQPCPPQDQAWQRSTGSEANRVTIEDSKAGGSSPMNRPAELFSQSDNACASPVVQCHVMQDSVYHDHMAQPTLVNIYLPPYIPSRTPNLMHMADTDSHLNAYSYVKLSPSPWISSGVGVASHQ